MKSPAAIANGMVSEKMSLPRRLASILIMFLLTPFSGVAFLCWGIISFTLYIFVKAWPNGSENNEAHL